MYRHSHGSPRKRLPTLLAAGTLVALIFGIMPLVNHTTFRRPPLASGDLAIATTAPLSGLRLPGDEPARSASPTLASEAPAPPEPETRPAPARAPLVLPRLEPADPGPVVRKALVYEASDLDAVPVAIHRVRPEYPPALRYQGIEGAVTVEFRVDEDGRVKDALITAASDPAFASSVLAAVARWRFLPGTIAGEKVRFRMRLPVTFRITGQEPAAAPVQVAEVD